MVVINLFLVNNIRYKIYSLPFLISLIALSLFSVSCSKDPIREKAIAPDNPDTTQNPTSYDEGIFVINEGNYNWGNASITFIDNRTNATVQDLYQIANQHNLGDVAESMKICNGFGFIVVNNSNRIEVVNLKNFKSVKSITGLQSPRFLELIDSTKAYVTNLQKDISILNLQSNTITGTIPIYGWTESLIRYDKYMLVTSIGKYSEPSSKRKAQILVIDTQTDKIVDSIQTGKEPIGLVIDKKQKVWVLCSGGFDNFEAPSLMRINPELRMVEKVFTFPTITEVPSRLCINNTGDTLYFLKGGVYQTPVTMTGLPTNPLISADGRLFYGLAIHPKTGCIYVSDSKDYVQNGTVYQYSPTAKFIKQYTAGRIPGGFCFTSKNAK
ncbi:MAG: hypothetical protein PHF97_05375 [Bacteroidales bacterium]|nr:hypothetical protein [Bacteroidales bacterium]